MVHYIQIHVRLFVFVTVLLCLLNFGCPLTAPAQTQRGPSDVVREFYKAMREHRFKDAWKLTIYKSAVETLTSEEMEDLRSDFAQRASNIPDQLQTPRQPITRNIPNLFVQL